MTVNYISVQCRKKMADYLRNRGLIQVVGKKRNALLYAITDKDTGSWCDYFSLGSWKRESRAIFTNFLKQIHRKQSISLAVIPPRLLPHAVQPTPLRLLTPGLNPPRLWPFRIVEKA